MSRIVEVLLPGVLSQPVQVLEVGLAVAAWLMLRLRPGWAAPLGALWRHAGRRPIAVMAGLACVLIVTHVALEWREDRRAPAIHDEFGYLLTAETFLEGRLTNPTPPEWRALDTIHVNFVPSYNSMYPPGQPAALAIAWRALGHPIYANWILAPLVGCATWWMLAGWTPPHWALLGGVLVLLRLGLYGYWAESYMAGALPAVAALVFAGALPRVARRPTASTATVGGLGLAVMFSSRPFESVVLGACAVPVTWMLTTSADRGRVVRAWLPGVLPFSIVVAAVAVCNVALTGSPLRFGYDLNMERHGYGVFAAEYRAAAEPLTHHMAAFYEETRQYAAYGWTFGGFIGTRVRSLGWAWVFLVGPLLSVGGRHWLRAVALRQLRPALPGLLGLAIVVAAHPWSFPHYYAGALGFIVLFAVSAIRLWAARHRLPPSLVGGTLATMAVLVLVARTVGGGAMTRAPLIPIEYLPYHMPPGFDARRDLDATAGRDGPSLILVRYAHGESLRRDWVYNAPAPEHARVVWANDLGPANNARTIHAYPARRLMCLEIASGTARQADCAGWMGRASE